MALLPLKILLFFASTAVAQKRLIENPAIVKAEKAADPNFGNLTDNAAIAAAWLEEASEYSVDLKEGDETPVGEIFLVQDNNITKIAGWLTGLEPETAYTLIVNQWGDLTEDGCDGNPFVTSLSGRQVSYSFESNFKGRLLLLDDEEFPVINCPLRGVDSVVGRMLVLQQLVNATEEEDDHRFNRTALYLPALKHKTQFKMQPVICGVIGVANGFNIFISEDEESSLGTIHCANFFLILSLLLYELIVK